MKVILLTLAISSCWICFCRSSEAWLDGLQRLCKKKNIISDLRGHRLFLLMRTMIQSAMTDLWLCCTLCLLDSLTSAMGPLFVAPRGPSERVPLAGGGASAPSAPHPTLRGQSQVWSSWLTKARSDYQIFPWAAFWGLRSSRNCRHSSVFKSMNSVNFTIGKVDVG